MATLYVENVPEALYTSLRERARAHRNSISAEVLNLLAENVPTEAELARRREFMERARKFRAKRAGGKAGFQTAEEMVREDRGR